MLPKTVFLPLKGKRSAHFFTSFFFMFKFMYWFWDRQRQCEQEKGRERERKSQAVSAHQCRAWHRVRTHETVRSWSEPKPRVGHLIDLATQAPLHQFLTAFNFFFTLYLFLIERQSTTGGGGETEKERKRDRIQSRLRALSCQHRA